jgi:hypothetical protein
VSEREKLPIDIAGTFDIETAGWTSFALGVCYDGVRFQHWWGTSSDLDVDADLPRSLSDGVTPIDPEDSGLDAMIDYLRARGGLWLGHGMGIFDGLAVLERCRVRGIPCQIDRSQHRVSRVVIGSLTMRDSYGLWPVPIDEICGALRRRVPHLPWRCECGRTTCSCGCGGCGGFCKIAEKAREGDPDLLAYCESDCRDLYDGIHLLRDFATANRIRLRGTLAQTAWVAAQEELGVPESDLPWHLYRAAKRADKGGRVAIIRPRASGVISHHDINSAYPAQLARTELPVGDCKELAGDAADRALDRCEPGLYTLSVRVPDDRFLPPLPWSHGGQVCFPVGDFTGTWCLPELVAAFSRGVTVLKVHSALVWEATAAIFGPLVHRWYEIRRAAGKKTPLGQWVSRLAKALTGKLAERPERERVLLHPDSIKICLRTGRCRNGCTGRCGAYSQLDVFGQIWGVPYQRLGGSSYPQWSAYLRAGTRVQWLEQAERQGTDLVLGNTDSIWTLGRDVAPDPAGDGLGQWELCETWADLDIRSHTIYAGHRLPDSTRTTIDRSHALARAETQSVPGEFVVRGIPWATEEDWKRGTGQIDRGVLTFGRATKSTRGLFQKRVRRWTLPRAAGETDRVYWGDRRMTSAGYTVPMTALEIAEQVRITRDRRQNLRAPEPGEAESRRKRRKAAHARAAR